jgi:polysaccharide pyruvyl transferase WcaK-like protein
MPGNIVFFQGKTQYENTGDVLINKSLVQLLRNYAAVLVNNKEMPESYVESLGLQPQECITKTGNNFNLRLLQSAFAAAVRKDAAKVYLIAGPPGHQFGNSIKKSFRNVLSGCYFSVLNVLGVKIIKIGFSIGPIGKAIACSEKFRALFTHHYLVRDSMSLRLSQDIGIQKAALFPDLAWLYALPKAVKPAEKRKVILSFRHAVTASGADDLYLTKLKQHLFAMLKSLDDTYEVEVVYQVKRDYDFAKVLFEELGKEIRLSFNEVQVSLENAGEVYGSGVCVLTNRLHVALLSYKYGALPLILTDAKDHLKIKGIYEDANAGALMLDVNSGLNENITQFVSLLQNRQALLHNLNNKEQEYSNLSKKTFEKIFSAS